MGSCCIAAFPFSGVSAPPGAELVLGSLSAGYLENLDRAMFVFVPWAVGRGYRFVTADVVNSFLSSVAAFAGTDFLAKNTRAGLDMLADFFSVSRPVDRMTGRLVTAITRNYQAGFKPIPELHVVKDVVLSQPKSRLHAVLALFCLSGFRPSDMNWLSSAGVPSEDLVWSVDAKNMRSGRNILSCPLMFPHLQYLRANCPGIWWRSTKADIDEVVMLMRTSMAQDPARLPPFTLRACRRFYATHMYNIGASSPFIMRQLNHLWWSTSKLYIVLPGGVDLVWRSRSQVADCDLGWVPASLVEFDFDTEETVRKWIQAWRKNLAGEVKVADDTDDEEVG